MLIILKYSPLHNYSFIPLRQPNTPSFPLTTTINITATITPATITITTTTDVWHRTVFGSLRSQMSFFPPIPRHTHTN